MSASSGRPRPLLTRVFRCVRLFLLRDLRWARDHFWDRQI
jgi:hypothetical protein